MAGAFAFDPELVAGAAEEGDVAGGERFVERFAIHEADHEHAFGGGVLDDGRDQAVLLVEIERFAHMLSVENEKAHLAAGRLQLNWKIETQTRLLDHRMMVMEDGGERSKTSRRSIATEETGVRRQ